MDSEITKHLQSAYVDFDVPADVIVTHPELREEFANKVRMRVGRPSIDADDLTRRLLRLRKAGKLPRLRKAG
jgi:hypothetical protein